MKDVSFEAARVRTTEALKAQGFGVLTEIDVKATFKAKLDREFRKYVILGACNPHLANQALEAELAIGLLLPCNVCIWEEEDGSVSIARPAVLFEMVRRDDFQPIANEADQRLRRALDQMRQRQRSHQSLVDADERNREPDGDGRHQVAPDGSSSVVLGGRDRSQERDEASQRSTFRAESTMTPATTTDKTIGTPGRRPAPPGR